MLQKIKLISAGFVFALFVIAVSSVAAQTDQENGKTKIPTLGCCKCLGGANSLDLSTIPSNNWTVNGNAVAFPTAIHSLWNLPTGTAKWVSTVLTGSTGNIPGGSYEYKLQFVVPNCTIDQKVTLSGNYGGDDDVQVFLDNTSGSAISSCSGGWCFNTKNPPAPFNTTITTPGLHILIIKVQNSGASPSGMFVNAKLTGTCSSKMTKSEKE